MKAGKAGNSGAKGLDFVVGMAAPLLSKVMLHCTMTAI
jgi:hypothetical protein